MIGTVAGSYRITGVVGHGGMATVYRAVHTLIGRSAAVKILNPEYAAKKSLVTRFFNEARVTTAIKHPGIVEVYDFGHLPSGQAFLVMEFLEGMPLSVRNKRHGPVSEGEAAAILRGVCSALAAAHAKGVVHRDLKPDNIFMVPDADSALGVRPKLLDFGIAKLTDVEDGGQATRTGVVIGTPAYMSPEQCAGNRHVDHRADLYSLGCIFYEMVTGRPPFAVRGSGELIAAHMMVTPEPPSRTAENLSPDTEALIMALLAKHPEQRPQSATELAAALSPIANRGGWPTMMSWESVRPSIPPEEMATIATPGSHLTPGPPSSPSSPGSQPAPASPPSPALDAVAAPVAGSTSAPWFTPQPTPADAALRPTTLSGAASQVSGDRSSRGSRVVLGAVIVIGLLVGGLATTFVLRGGSSDDVAPANAPAPAPASTVTMPVAAPAGSAEAEPAPAAPATPEAPVAAEVPANAESQAAAEPAEKTESAKTESAKTESAKTESAKTESAKTESAKTETAKTEGAKTKTAKTETAKTEGAKTERAKHAEHRKHRHRAPPTKPPAPETPSPTTSPTATTPLLESDI